MANLKKTALFLLVLFGLGVAAPAPADAACNRIAERNKRLYCTGITESLPRICHQIIVNALKYSCLATTTLEPRHCYNITSVDDRELCLSTTGFIDRQTQKSKTGYSPFGTPRPRR